MNHTAGEMSMTGETIRKTKWFWPWQDEQEETWLAQMSLQGLHLKQADIGAQYEFLQGAPQQYIYRLDFRDSMKQKDKQDYLQLFDEAGWEFIGEMNSWQYFRRPAQADKNAEIFTDAESKIQKYQRVLTWFGLTYPFYLLILVTLIDEQYPSWLTTTLVVTFVLSSALWLMILAKVWLRIRQLRTRI
jgi:hypothetical protein